MCAWMSLGAHHPTVGLAAYVKWTSCTAKTHGRPAVFPLRLSPCERADQDKRRASARHMQCWHAGNSQTRKVASIASTPWRTPCRDWRCAMVCGRGLFRAHKNVQPSERYLCRCVEKALRVSLRPQAHAASSRGEPFPRYAVTLLPLHAHSYALQSPTLAVWSGLWCPSHRCRDLLAHWHLPAGGGSVQRTSNIASIFGFEKKKPTMKELREEPGKTGAPCVKVPGSSRVPAPPWVGSRSPDGWDQIPYRHGGWVLHQPPWSFGFDSQRRGTREFRRILPLKYRVPHGSQ